MNKRILVVIALMALLATSCSTVTNNGGWTIGGRQLSLRGIRGSGTMVSETREISGVRGLVLEGIGDVVVTQGDSESLTIEAEDNILPLIESEVRDGTLHITFSRDRWEATIHPTKAITYRLSVQNMDLIETAGAGTIHSDGIKTGALSVSIKGAGDVKIANLSANEVHTTIAGTGRVDIAGQATRQDATLDGAGSYETPDLSTQQAFVTVNGVGGATVWAKESLNVRINGVGSVNYYGQPQVSKNVQGAGSIKGLGSK